MYADVQKKMVRPLSFPDRPKILKLVEQSAVFTEKEIRVAIEIVDETLIALPNKSDYRIHCMDDGSGGLAGYICYGRIPLTDECFDLYWIAVDRKCSRAGIGGILLSFMENDLMEEGGGKVYVETSSTSPYLPARRFYMKNGYAPVCTLEDFYRKGDHKLIFMKELAGR